jgi:hypothetical protein
VAEGLSDVNVRKHLRILSTVLSHAVDDELIPANPAIGTRRARRSKAGQAACRRIDPLTREELRTLLETARDRTIPSCTRHRKQRAVESGANKKAPEKSGA